MIEPLVKRNLGERTLWIGQGMGVSIMYVSTEKDLELIAEPFVTTNVRGVRLVDKDGKLYAQSHTSL